VSEPKNLFHGVASATAADEGSARFSAIHSLEARLKTSTVEAFGIETASVHVAIDGERTFLDQIYPLLQDVAPTRSYGRRCP
jgi:hypothetical protein